MEPQIPLAEANGNSYLLNLKKIMNQQFRWLKPTAIDALLRLLNKYYGCQL